VSATPNASPRGLRRILGRWDLTALGLNQVIGGAIFAVPASLAAHAGAWSPLLVVAVGAASLLIALSFAEVGSRFEGTGGPYLYARAAFGRFAAFEIGWMAWVTRVASWASILNVLVATLGFYWPVVTGGAPRAALMTLVAAVIAAINVRGIRQSSVAINLFTVGKLAPLLIFVVVGFWFADAGRLIPSRPLSFAEFSSAALLLIFAFGGYENIPIPAGEARDPRRAVPFALVTTILIVTAIFAAIQTVALGTLPTLPVSTAPLADAAAIFLGPAGAALLTIGATVSIAGNNLGGAVAGSRLLFALGEQGDLPSFFGRIHRIYRTPVPAILTTCGITLVLALSGTFVVLAQTSAVSRLVVYVGTCAAAIRLREAALAGMAAPASFLLPFGATIPAAAIVIALGILAGSTRMNLLAGGVALVCGAIVYWTAARRRESDQLVPRSARR
jgi:amino acid transporter